MGLSQIWASFPNARRPIQKTLASSCGWREFFVDFLQRLALKNQFETAPLFFVKAEKKREEIGGIPPT